MSIHGLSALTQTFSRFVRKFGCADGISCAFPAEPRDVVREDRDAIVRVRLRPDGGSVQSSPSSIV
jgi:hypothetical protein